MISLVKFILFNLFVGKGFYHPDSQQTVFYLSVNFTNLVP